MKKLASLLVVPALICALAGEGLAEESTPEPERKWYGWQILVSDAVSSGMVMAGAVDDSPMPALAYFGALGFLGVPPAIHGAHHHPGRAAASVLLRIGFPVAGALLGNSMADCSSPNSEFFCGMDEAALGFGIGMVAASAIDAIIAWDTRTPAQPTPPPPTRSTRRSPVSFTSAGIAPTSNGAKLVVGGTF